MTKQDSLTAGVTAAVVAVLTLAITAPPICRAEEEKSIMVPALPPTALTIPSINTEVSAQALPVAGRAVWVTLAVNSPSGTELARVPVTVAVLSTTMNPLARSLPEPRLVTQVEASIPVGPDGKGTAVVELPGLIWAPPAATAPTAEAGKDESVKLLRTVTFYQIALSSPLGGKPAPSAVNTLAIQAMIDK